MPVLDHLALEDTAGMDLLRAALGEPRSASASPPESRSIGRRAGVTTPRRTQSTAAPRFPFTPVKGQRRHEEKAS